MAFLYMVECVDGTIYTGIAADIERRLKEHKERGPKCAKYTRSHPVKELKALWQTEDYAAAAKGEYAVKRLTRSEKLRLIAEPERLQTFCPSLEDIVFRPTAAKDFPTFL